MNEAPLRTLCGLPAELREIIYEFAIYEPARLYLMRPRSNSDPDPSESPFIVNESRSALTSWCLRRTCRAIKRDLDQLQTFYKVNTFFFLPYSMRVGRSTISRASWKALRDVVLDINSQQFSNKRIWALVQRECFTRESLTIDACDTALALSPRSEQIDALEKFADLLSGYTGPCNLKYFKLRYTLVNYYEWRSIPISVTYHLTVEGDNSFVEVQSPAEMALLVPALTERLAEKFPEKTRRKYLAVKKLLLGLRMKQKTRLVDPGESDARKAVEVENGLGSGPGGDQGDRDNSDDVNNDIEDEEDEVAVTTDWDEDDSDESEDDEGEPDDVTLLESIYSASLKKVLATAVTEAAEGGPFPALSEQTARSLKELDVLATWSEDRSWDWSLAD